jgi:uncharacterized Zn finger protein (UPF0148 family)
MEWCKEMNIDKLMHGATCLKCGKPKIIRPDGGLFCSECQRKAEEQFGNKIRPDVAKKGKVELQWDAQTEQDDDTLIYED